MWTNLVIMCIIKESVLSDKKYTFVMFIPIVIIKKNI